jgi:hypothetical protein
MGLGGEAPSLEVQYIVLDAVLAVLSVVIVAGLLRLRACNARLELRLRSSVSLRHLGASVLRIGLELGMPLLALVFAPSVMQQAGISWPTVLDSAPDLAWWTLLFANLLLLTGVLHAVLLVRAIPGQEFPDSPPVRPASDRRASSGDSPEMP